MGRLAPLAARAIIVAAAVELVFGHFNVALIVLTALLHVLIEWFFF